MSEKKDIKKIGCVFGLEGLVLREDLLIAGSPERTEYRVVGEARDGQSSLIVHKRHMAHIIGLLNLAGFNKAVPYLRNVAQHEHVVEVDGDHWQVVPFVAGVSLVRPDHVFDHWRGEVMADILLKLRTASLSVPECAQKDTFMLPAYIDKLVSVIKTRRPEISSTINKMHSFVRERLYPVYDRLPTGFCHGDYHAVNMIWGQKDAVTLIDWEFMGVKPELYDAANMISCLGVEDPACLIDGAPVSFVRALRQADVYQAESFDHLLDLVIALRFAWISEWLRKKDEEMLQLEFDYFDLLMENYSGIMSCWGQKK